GRLRNTGGIVRSEVEPVPEFIRRGVEGNGIEITGKMQNTVVLAASELVAIHGVAVVTPHVRAGGYHAERIIEVVGYGITGLTHTDQGPIKAIHIPVNLIAIPSTG